MTIGLVYGRLRREEKLLLEAGERLDIPITPIYDADLVLDIDGGGLPDIDATLLRSVSTSRGYYVGVVAKRAGKVPVNDPNVARICQDKLETSIALSQAGVPTPRSTISFEDGATLRAAQGFGYPVVMKPVTGSWARLVHRADHDGDLAQQLEYRAMLSNPSQHVHYLQEYVDKTRSSESGPAFRDLRAFVIGDETICGIWRESPNWVTNTARGGRAYACPIMDDLDDLCQRAATAVGGGILAIDLMETPDGFTVHEINHTMEFRNSIAPTGVDIPGRMIQYVHQEARR